MSSSRIRLEPPSNGADLREDQVMLGVHPEHPFKEGKQGRLKQVGGETCFIAVLLF
jgi:hypothetical protein